MGRREDRFDTIWILVICPFTIALAVVVVLLLGRLELAAVFMAVSLFLVILGLIYEARALKEVAK